MTVIERIDLPFHRMETWHCERCGGTACEVSSDEGSIPTACPCGHEPTWRCGRWRTIR